MTATWTSPSIGAVDHSHPAVTPQMFTYRLPQQAQPGLMRIVLPEGTTIASSNLGRLLQRGTST